MKLIDLNNDYTITKAHLIVSTPGITVKAFKKSILNHLTCKVVVFDEADTMLGSADKDHCSIIARNMSQVANVQLLGFAATMNPGLTEWFNATFNNS